jgi:peptidoglycan-N-acetylglucosamine deacetylase
VKSLLLIQPKALLKKVYPKAIWNFTRSEKTIYLTFDDGPIPELTEWVLDELNKFQIKATFFCVGANIIRNRSIFERLISEGHQVANHTMFHTKGLKTSTRDYLKDVEGCEIMTNTKVFRPPYGKMKQSQYKALLKRGYKIVMWDVISYDYEKISPQKVWSKVLNNTKNGSVVLFHDNLKAVNNLKFALPKFLKHYSELGYSFKTIA